MGKSRNVGKGRKHLQGNGMGDATIYIGYLRQMLEQGPPERDGEVGYFEDIILQEYCIKMVKMFPELPTDELVLTATSPGEPAFEMLTTDLGGACMWSNDRLKDIICKKLDQIKNHEPFVRKVLFVYWVLKIEDNDEFKKELIMVSKEDISPEDRQAKLQKLSDKYFKHDDFTKMTPFELEWYCTEYNEGKRPNLMKQMGKMSSAKVTSLPPYLIEEESFLIKLMERAVKYGVDIQLNKMKLKNEESFGAEVEKLQNKLTDIEANLASQETLLEKRNQEILQLKEQLESRDEKIKRLESKFEKFVKIPLAGYSPLPDDNLVKKCLELAGEAQTIKALSIRILMNCNYDEDVVELKKNELSDRIDRHLNSRDEPIPWNRRYLLKQSKKIRSGVADCAQLVEDLLKLKT